MQIFFVAAVSMPVFLLVVEDDVRSPDVVRRYGKHVATAILSRVPLELVVSPVLLHPQVGRHDLVLQVLKLPMVS